jgi:phage shock protein A
MRSNRNWRASSNNEIKTAMGLLSRLQEISTGKLLAFLEKAEHPELLIPQLLQELGEQQRALHTAEAKSLATVRSAQRKLEETMGRSLRMERGAQLALAKGEETTAREALREQIKIEKQIPQQRNQVEQAQKILDEVRERKNALQAQADAVRQLQTRTQSTPPPPLPPSDSLLSQVAQMDESVAVAEAECDARQETFQRKRSLDERLIELERTHEVEKRLNHLRKDQNHDG